MYRNRFVAVWLGVMGSVSGCGPGYPTNVRAEISGNTVTISWDAVRGAKSYDVCRKMEGYFGSSGSCSFMGACEDTLETHCSYNESPTPQGNTTTYTYRVRADDGDWGEWSNPIQH